MIPAKIPTKGTVRLAASMHLPCTCLTALSLSLKRCFSLLTAVEIFAPILCTKIKTASDCIQQDLQISSATEVLPGNPPWTMLWECSLQGFCKPNSRCWKQRHSPHRLCPLSSHDLGPIFFSFFVQALFLLRATYQSVSIMRNNQLSYFQSLPQHNSHICQQEKAAWWSLPGSCKKSLVLQSDPQMLHAAGCDTQSPCSHRDCILWAVTLVTRLTWERQLYFRAVGNRNATVYFVANFNWYHANVQFSCWEAALWGTVSFQCKLKGAMIWACPQFRIVISLSLLYLLYWFQHKIRLIERQSTQTIMS